MSTRGLSAKVDLGGLQVKLAHVERLLVGADKTALFRSIAQTLEAETEANFAAQGRPTWVPHADSTKADRLKRNKGGSVLKILQDGGILAASISSYYGEDSVVIGAGGAAKDYAAVHQYGGDVNIPAHQRTVKLRTTAGGKLERQGKIGSAKNLAVFARGEGPRAHKRFVEKTAQVPAYTVQIPSRPYLPFSGPPGGETLQPEAGQSILDTLERGLRRVFG